MGLLSRYRATGADLPFGDQLRAHPGVRMEGYFWRFTAPPGDGRVVIALCGVNRADDGTWSTLGLAGHPNGFLRAVEHPEGWADPDRFGALAGTAFHGAADSLHVDLGPDAGLDVRVADGVPWGRRSFGGSSFFQSVPALNQYWHPWLLGGSAHGTARLGGDEWELDGWRVYAEKNWGRGGFPDSWWWGQAQGFAEPEACVAFAGGEIESGPLRTEVTAVVVRLPGGRLLRLGNPGTSPVAAADLRRALAPARSQPALASRGRGNRPAWRVPRASRPAAARAAERRRGARAPGRLHAGGGAVTRRRARVERRERLRRAGARRTRARRRGSGAARARGSGGGAADGLRYCLFLFLTFHL